MKPWIGKYLSEAEVQGISSLIAQAEAKSQGEIVPMIVRRSSAIGHVRMLLTLFLSVLFFVIEIPSQGFFANHWFITLSPLVVFVFWAVAGILAKIPSWQRILTSEADKNQQVWQRAELEFSRHKMQNTIQQTGILIFVSVMERKAVILADLGISQSTPPETWKNLVEELTIHLKAGHWGKGFEKAIQEAGKILAEKIPAQQHDSNELANHLRILE